MAIIQAISTCSCSMHSNAMRAIPSGGDHRALELFAMRGEGIGHLGEAVRSGLCSELSPYFITIEIPVKSRIATGTMKM